MARIITVQISEKEAETILEALEEWQQVLDDNSIDLDGEDLKENEKAIRGLEKLQERIRQAKK